MCTDKDNQIIKYTDLHSGCIDRNIYMHWLIGYPFARLSASYTQYTKW